MTHIENQVNELMNIHVRTGSKNSRREEREKAVRLVRWLVQNQRGVNGLENIGRAHIHQFYQTLRDAGRAETTIDKYHNAIVKLWRLMGREGNPPKP